MYKNKYYFYTINIMDCVFHNNINSYLYIYSHGTNECSQRCFKIN